MGWAKEASELIHKDNLKIMGETSQTYEIMLEFSRLPPRGIGPFETA
jgi:hypothetical protein